MTSINVIIMIIYAGVHGISEVTSFFSIIVLVFLLFDDSPGILKFMTEVMCARCAYVAGVSHRDRHFYSVRGFRYVYFRNFNKKKL